MFMFWVGLGLLAAVGRGRILIVFHVQCRAGDEKVAR